LKKSTFKLNLLVQGEKFPGITILDALSASGLRPIRYLKELPDIKKVIANDLSEAALTLMKENMQNNEIDMSKVES
jgi:tRNA (guanine26-N2/guanine27-N2)-dimethyltransferase